MRKVQQYRQKLKGLLAWDEFLLQESNLPGKRANLELVQAVADMGDEELFLHFLTFDPESAPTNTPQEFLAMCGVVGLGRLLAEGSVKYLETLRIYANDPRWRIREGVAFALQRFGRQDMQRLLDEMRGWSKGTFLEQRAVVAGLCEPDLLSEEKNAVSVLELLDNMTASLAAAHDRNTDSFKILRKGLGYGWSVAVAACPQAGKDLLEKWLSSPDKDVRWILRENLRKNRLKRLDPQWVKDGLDQL